MAGLNIERLWRSLKSEAVHEHELEGGLDTRRVLDEWIGLYNTKRGRSVRRAGVHKKPNHAQQIPTKPDFKTKNATIPMFSLTSSKDNLSYK